ncbi:MAG TPA: ATP-binding protein [Verrucomicrobiae bacterium]|nr:ATP-binding protein [Verrucomicrobiae bacterium]
MVCRKLAANVRKFQDIPIKQKLTVIIMIASTVALLLVAAGFVAYDLDTFRKKMVNDLSTLAEIIGDRSEAALSFKDQAVAQDMLHALVYQKHIVAAALYDASGKLLAQYPRNATATSFPDPLKSAAAPQFGHDRLGRNGLMLFHKIYAGPDFVGTLYLESDLQAQNELLAHYAGIVLLLISFTWLLTLFLSGRLQRVISRPIFDLAETARTVSADKKYSVRATKHGGDELGRLTDDFNEMLGQIQQRDLELQKARDELEIRVQERTQDLRVEIAERQRTESALRQQFVRTSLLNRITHAISERQDMKSIFDVVLRQLEENLGLDLGVAALFDAQSQTLNVTALHIKNAALATRFDLREGSALALVETDFQSCEKGQTVYLSDTRKATAPFSAKLATLGWRTVAAVPLMVEEKLWGLLISARSEINGFASGDCEFLRMLSEHVALAAHQARLHQDLEYAYDELRRTQAAVLQQERLKALGQMASGVAHDVTNAISPVVGFSEMLLKQECGLNPEGKRFLSYIRTAGQDITHIITRLREFYRKHEDTESLQRLNLNALVEQVVNMTRPRWRDITQSNGITIEMRTELAPEVPELVGIESEIREAFTNLVLNAVDAMPEGGKITLRTSVIHCEDVGRTSSHVIVDIIDTGVGMSEEIRKRCLEPFFSTKGKRGTGLGLAMVYGVMQRHEGSVDIQSAPGQGTTFRLIFPVRDQLRAAVEKEEEETLEPVAPLRILCIDDEPLLRELIKEMLGRDGHQVEVSDSGQSGLDQFRLARERGRPFDVVITDLGMPYVDGRQVAKAVKQESPGTPVIMLTGWGALMKDDDNVPPQVDIIVSKPPGSRDLRKVLSRLQIAARLRSRK